MLADRLATLQPSPTLAMQAKAKAMRAQGIDVISFGAGEPDFDTPRRIKDAAIRALEQGHTKYTEVGGIPELRAAVCHKLKRDKIGKHTSELQSPMYLVCRLLLEKKKKKKKR